MRIHVSSEVELFEFLFSQSKIADITPLCQARMPDDLAIEDRLVAVLTPNISPALRLISTLSRGRRISVLDVLNWMLSEPSLDPREVRRDDLEHGIV